MDAPLKIDLNCDLGESFGRYTLGNDVDIMPLITSANVACGFHAGDPSVMARTVQLVKQNQVALGAHPGYPDLGGFGRRQMGLSSQEIKDIITYQIGALSAFARAVKLPLVHVKPHGALYNLAAKEMTVAKAIAQAVLEIDPALILVGLAGSKMIEAGEALGLRVANEGFPDRAYLPDGQLMPRGQHGALLHEPGVVAENAVRLVEDGLLVNGKNLRIDTLCLHGDNEHALENALAVRRNLKLAGISIASLREIVKVR